MTANISVVVREDKSGTTEIWKKSLAAFDSGFNTIVGTSSKSSFVSYNSSNPSQILSKGWPTSNIRADTNGGVSAYVLANAGSIGYSVLGEVRFNVTSGGPEIMDRRRSP